MINNNNDDVYQVDVAGSVIGAVDIARPVTHRPIRVNISGAIWSLLVVQSDDPLVNIHLQSKLRKPSGQLPETSHSAQRFKQGPLGPHSQNLLQSEIDSILTSLVTNIIFVFGLNHKTG